MEPTPSITPIPSTTPEPTPTPNIILESTPIPSSSVTPTLSPSPTPSITPSKNKDEITINLMTATYNGSKITTTATSKSGLPVSISYYNDSNCTTIVNNSKFLVDAGIYYARGTTSGNNNYYAGSSLCTKAVVINKANDVITINYKSSQYTGSRITTTATSKSGLPVSLTYYSNSLCTITSKSLDFLVSPGTYYAIGTTIGNNNYNSAKSACTKAIDIIGLYASSVSINKNAISVKKGETYKLTATVLPSNAIDKTVTWKSSNTNVATVNSNGLVTGINTGNVTITATTSNGKTAIVSVAVIGSDLVDSYESSTLNYYIEKPDWTYIVTHIWVKDAYNQMKVAITPQQNSNSLLPRTILGGSQIMRNEVDTKNYQNKGLVAVNGSAMVSTEFNETAPAHWFGTSAIPYVLNDGQVIRDSTEEQLKVAKNNIIYGLTKNGYLKSYSYTLNGYNYINNPTSFKSNINNDGVKYTFGFRPIILENGKAGNSSTDKNIREVLCQVDKNNFIIITSN